MLFQFALYGSGGVDPTNLTPADFIGLLLRVAQYALALIGAIAFIYILVAGIQYITASGDPGKQGEARKAINAALFGFIITILGFSIVGFLLQRIGFDATIFNEEAVNPIPSAGLYRPTPGTAPGTTR